MAPQDLAAFGLTATSIPSEEIEEQSQGKWSALYDALVKVDGGLFVSPFTRKDTQNFSNAARKKAAARGFSLRWKQGKRGDAEGFYLWLVQIETAAEGDGA